MTNRLLLFVVVVLITGCSGSLPASQPATTQFSRADFAHFTPSALWNVVSSPSVGESDGLYDDALNAVAGTSANDVWAVGYDCCTFDGTIQYSHGLILHWNGSKWSVVPGAKNAPEDVTLESVSALAPNDAWAVGKSVHPTRQAVFEHWNGKQWSIVTSPRIYGYGEMLSVVMIAKNNVWAAGDGNYAAVLEHWDGKSWAFIPAYDQGLTVLNSLAASGPNDIWAVGENLDTATFTFTEHYDGRSWTYHAGAGQFNSSQFQSVTDLSPKDAWAVGYETAQTDQPPQTLIEHWNGSAWSLVTSPNRDPKGSPILNNILSGVAARSANDITAVGAWTWYPGDGTTRSLFEHYN
jgi:hypothetical protein